MFSCKSCEIFRNTFPYKTPPATASENSQIAKSNKYILGKYITSFTNNRTCNCDLLLNCDGILFKNSIFKKGTPVQVFSYENGEGFWNSYFAEPLQPNASAKNLQLKRNEPSDVITANKRIIIKEIRNAHSLLGRTTQTMSALFSHNFCLKLLWRSPTGIRPKLNTRPKLNVHKILTCHPGS